MHQRTRKFIVGILLTASMVSFLWVAFDWLQLDPIQRVAAQDGPEIVLEQSNLVRYDEAGHALWTVHAKAIELNEETRKTVAEQVEVQFWNTETPIEGEQTAMLTVVADQLTFDNLSQDLNFEGKIMAQNEEGLQFLTSNATWSNKQQVLEGDEAVNVTHPWGESGVIELQGVGFRYDAQTGKILLSDPTGESDATLRWLPQGDTE